MNPSLCLLVIALAPSAASAFPYYSLQAAATDSLGIAEVEVRVPNRGKGSIRVLRWIRPVLHPKYRNFPIKPALGLPASKKMVLKLRTFIGYMRTHLCKHNRTPEGLEPDPDAWCVSPFRPETTLLDRALKRGSYRATLLLSAIGPGMSSPTHLALKRKEMSEFTLKSWHDHPDHKRWKKRLFRLLKEHRALRIKQGLDAPPRKRCGAR